MIRLDESVVPVEVTISSLRTAQGLTLRVIVRDISQRHRLQRVAEAKKDGFLDAYAQGDADRLSQAVDNLLTNSLKFSPADGEVAVALSTDAETVTMSDTNAGEGIPEADVTHVFDRLYRGENAVAAEKQGVGLGLSIVRSIVEAHRGSVSAARTPTTTCFEITLPRAALVSV